MIALRNLRREAYQRYLKSYRKSSFLPPSLTRLEEAQAQVAASEEYWVAYSELFTLASDAMLLAVTDFHEVAWVGDTDLSDEEWDK